MALNLPYSNEEFLRIVKLAEGVSNRNLLDNWYFADPINQRGATEYTGSVNTIDRWRGSTRHIVSVIDGGVRVTCSESASYSMAFSQNLEDLKIPEGTPITLSFYVTANTTTGGVGLRYNATSGGSLGAGETGLLKTTFEYVPGSFYVGLHFVAKDSDDGNYVDIRAAKLEIGEYSTLENDAPPNKAEELAKCQRFFQRYRTQSLRPTYADDCRPVMRAEPTVGTITANGTTYYTLSADL